ncbi:MAG TPA: hypothetical protein VK761_07475 [Solirubrobacteraceae bacterium]|jgi:hypothetical protein|nr:hypothetical protein [Solirubrobacteraceae bacterium]
MPVVNGLAVRAGASALGVAAVCAVLSATALAAGTPVFLHRGGAVHERTVDARVGVTSFEVLRGLAQVTCKSGSAVGKLAGGSNQRSISGVRFALVGCSAQNNVTGRTCTVKSAKAQASDEIVTNKLQGRLVEVAHAEATSGVGLALAPKGAHAAFLTFQVPKGSGCVPLPKPAGGSIPVSGGAIAEVGHVGVEATTQPLYLEVEKGAYGETSQAIQHALGAPQLVLMSFGGIESPIAGDLTLTFAESVEISG